jgi:hypothetical protein
VRGFKRVESDDLRGMMPWIQENTKWDYSQKEHGVNAPVVGDGGDGEILGLQGDDARGNIAWI